MPLQPWDLVVFDEAHTICGESQRHAIGQEIARRSRLLLLLTATPHDGDETRFRRLLALGALENSDVGDDGPVVFRRTRADLGSGPGRRIRRLTMQPTEAERRVLDALREFERRVLSSTSAEGHDAALLLLAVFRKRALSSFAALVISLQRRLAWIGGRVSLADEYWLQTSFDFEDADDNSETDQRALLGELDLAPERERPWLRRLLELALAAKRRDSRLARVTALLARTREPAVVFTEFRHTLDALSARLGRARAQATLHGGQTDAERTRELQRFLSGDADVLLATDVASLGLNLQSRARWVISVDLPWTPARLEQRAGRVDRIGQTRPVHVTLLAYRHDAEARLLEQLSRRAETARRAIGESVFTTTPTDAALRAWVIAGIPMSAPACSPPDTSTRLALCTRWTRVARRHVRALARQRALARSWRAPATLDARPRRCEVRRRGAWSACVAPATVVFTVPLADGSGLVLERHVVAVRLNGPLSADAHAARRALNEARRLAAETMRPRVRALTRWVTERAALNRARERAVHDDLDMQRAREAQPGLFDARAERRLELADRAVRDRHDERDERDAALDEAARVTVGRPKLELIFEARP
jgi:superfamily II DNA or RNA helicase